MYTYDNPLRISYSFLGAAIDTDLQFGTFIGPAGKTGRIAAVVLGIIAATTGADGDLEIGLAANGTEFLAGAIPNIATDGGWSASEAEIALGADIPADTAVFVGSGGANTAGDADITVVVDWY
jgi:hypothetical protein